jgi:GntR family transcriptional regulator
MMPLVDQAHAALLRLSEELADRSVRRLPPERDLAVRLGISRTTVRKALEVLEHDGVIRRVRGRAGGAYLTQVGPGAAEDLVDIADGRRLQRSLNTVKGVPQMLHEQGFREGTKVISARLRRPPPRAAVSLGVHPDDDVVSLLRLRFADGDTLSLEWMYLSASRCAGILGTYLDSVYEALRTECDVRVSSADEAIDLATVNEPVGELLGQPVGTPVLRLERVGYDELGSPIEYSVDLFRADRTRLNVHTGAA